MKNVDTGEQGNRGHDYTSTGDIGYDPTLKEVKDTIHQLQINMKVGKNSITAMSSDTIPTPVNTVWKTSPRCGSLLIARIHQARLSGNHGTVNFRADSP